MEVKINHNIFRTGMNFIKNSIGKDDNRHRLTLAKIEVDEKYIRFISLDGIKSCHFEIEHKDKDVIPFECFLRYFDVGLDKQGSKNIEIEKIDALTVVRYFDLDGNKIIREFDYDGDYANIKEIYPEIGEWQIAFYVDNLIAVLKSFRLRSKMEIKLHIQGKYKPMLITSKIDDGELKGLIMPIRGQE